jgi:hypothetical protein
VPGTFGVSILQFAAHFFKEKTISEVSYVSRNSVFRLQKTFIAVSPRYIKNLHKKNAFHLPAKRKTKGGHKTNGCSAKRQRKN